MTKRLYYDDAYTAEFSARIIEHTMHENRPAVILDATYFYPTGGGQPHDTGTLNGVNVIDVVTREGDLAILHVLESTISDDTVTGVIDVKRRFDYMQQHTGQHILTQAFVQVANANTVSFHLGDESVTIDLDKLNIPAQTVQEVETLVNHIIFENRPVSAHIINPDDREGVRMRKMPDYLATDGLRVIDVQDFDLTACGGTHVSHTGEIGLLKIIKLEKRGDNTRVEFRCGDRALVDYRLKNNIVHQLTSLTNVGLADLPDAVTRMQEQMKAAQRQLKTVTNQLIEFEIADALSNTPLSDGVRVIRRVFEDTDMDTLRMFASKAIQHDSNVVMLGLAGERSQIIFARSANLTINLNPVLQAALKSLGEGRGGGRPDFVQGGGVPATSQQLIDAMNHAEKVLFDA